LIHTLCSTAKRPGIHEPVKRTSIGFFVFFGGGGGGGVIHGCGAGAGVGFGGNVFRGGYVKEVGSAFTEEV